jgi:hypothetical protein
MQGRQILLNTAIGIALLVLMLPLLYVADFAIERTLHRLEVRRQIRQASLQTLVLDAQQLRWVEKGKEILVAGEYFDVEAFRIENGKAFVTGFFDHRETEMHKAFLKQNHHKDLAAGGAPQIAQWLLQQWGSPASAIVIAPGTLERHITISYLSGLLPAQPAVPPEQPPQPRASV